MDSGRPTSRATPSSPVPHSPRAALRLTAVRPRSRRLQSHICGAQAHTLPGRGRWPILALGLCLGPSLSCTADANPVRAATLVRTFTPCADPQPGLRFVEESAARGLGDPPPAGAPPARIPGAVAQDFDGDGDIDLARLHSGPPECPVSLSWNDGTGHFDATDPFCPPLPFDGPHAFALGAADLDGDRLPELLLSGPGLLLVAANDGGAFEDFRSLYEAPDGATPQWSSFNVGDVDGDGDLDVLITTTWATFAPGGDGGDFVQPPGADLLLLQDGGQLRLERELLPYGRAAYAQIGLFTDRDFDGDLDLLVPSEFGTSPGVDPSAFWRNDSPGSGAVVLENDAVAVGTDYAVTGMGADTADLNADGRMDFCVVQIGATLCALSSGEQWVESGLDLGIGQSPGTFWSGYGFEFVDLDHDGRLDAVAAGGSALPGDSGHVDRIWVGRDGGRFEDVASALGVANVDQHFGVAMADYDGDGHAELYFATGGGAAPSLLRPGCTGGHAVEVDVLGPVGNRQGYGATVWIEARGRSSVREIHGLRAVGQGPPLVRFGLGTVDSIDRITARLPGRDVVRFDGPFAVDAQWRLDLRDDDERRESEAAPD